MGGETKETRPAINRTYKDTLFRMIFREKQSLLQLYNALNGTDYTNEDDLVVVTLENAIYMNLKNDVAFILSDWLNLYEHQSTPNPNIPLRNLFYICREYEKLVEWQSLYSSVKIQIPNPRFVVFYNGTEPQEERKILKLSDLYCHPEENPELELTVCLLNINRGYNNAIMEQCRLLSEYMQYVDKVKTYAGRMPISDAVERAITESLKQGILSNFLTKYRREAIQVSIFEYDEEKELRLMRQAEQKHWMQEGIEEGIQQGIQQGVQQGLQRGIQQGVQQGLQRGIQQGVQQGLQRGIQQGVQQGQQQRITVDIRNLMDTMKLSLNQAMNALKIPAEEQASYAARIRNQ